MRQSAQRYGDDEEQQVILCYTAAVFSIYLSAM